MMCGGNNPLSVGLSFRVTESGMVCASFQARADYQGYDGIMHGGFIAALLDAAMTNCLFKNGIVALTGDLHVRFHKPVPCDASIDLKAQIVSKSPPLFFVRSELVCGKAVMASAEAKFMKPRKL